MIYFTSFLLDPSHSFMDRRGTVPNNQTLPFFSFICSSHKVAQFKTCTVLDIIFLSLFSVFMSFFFLRAYFLCTGKSSRFCIMSMPPHFTSYS